ncbi:uncharacterized protein LOC127102699 [Lathyrus oleraceus]|uniref:uncharacterized protein LOC127102699 n=1 Tax=Pisum sativum TaxID=3888 RepID=UPI0021D20CB7|nr:uncharacterized protein LOC127102699 [Pisum sativum]
MLAQDPLEEVDLGEGVIKRPTYISANIHPQLKIEVVQLLREFKDCFAWDYDEMPGLSRELVKLKLPVKPGKKPVKQNPRQFVPAILLKIKEEVERLLHCNFIRTARYVEWLVNIVPVLKKNGYEYLSMLDGYSGYNQIFIAEEDVPKIAFRCPGALGTYEWDGDFLGFVVHKKGIEINQNKTKAIMEVKGPSTKKGLQSLLGKINFLRRFISNLSGKTQAFSPLLRLNNEVFEWGQTQQEAFDKIKAYLSHPSILTPPCRNKSMRLYISVSDKTLGSMLAQEDDNGVKIAIYYLSRVLNDVETSRIGKRALALTGLYLTCMPLRAVKGQVVTDFIVDHSIDANALNYVELRPRKLYFNGSSQKDGTGIGVVIISPNKILTKFQYKVEGTCSNNEAEYEALITGLEMLMELGATRVEIMGDLDLVIKQIIKEYRCVKENLIMYFIITSRLLKNFEMVYIRHIPRIENKVANDLTQIASGYKILKEKLHKVVEVRGKFVETILTQLDLENTKLGYADEGNFEILAIDNLADEDWKRPIVVYLQNPTTSTD